MLTHTHYTELNLAFIMLFCRTKAFPQEEEKNTKVPEPISMYVHSVLCSCYCSCITCWYTNSKDNSHTRLCQIHIEMHNSARLTMSTENSSKTRNEPDVLHQQHLMTLTLRKIVLNQTPGDSWEGGWWQLHYQATSSAKRSPRLL